MDAHCHRQTFPATTDSRPIIRRYLQTTCALLRKLCPAGFAGHYPESPMAKCDEGYICHVCGKDVESIVDSDLYLRYVLGQVDPEVLHTTPERHIRCNPLLAQFIDDERFDPVTVDGNMGLANLDADHVAERRRLVTRAWQRLWELKGVDGVSILDYPLEEFRGEDSQ